MGLFYKLCDAEDVKKTLLKECKGENRFENLRSSLKLNRCDQTEMLQSMKEFCLIATDLVD